MQKNSLFDEISVGHILPGNWSIFRTGADGWATTTLLPGFVVVVVVVVPA